MLKELNPELLVKETRNLCIYNVKPPRDLGISRERGPPEAEVEADAENGKNNWKSISEVAGPQELPLYLL